MGAEKKEQVKLTKLNENDVKDHLAKCHIFSSMQKEYGDIVIRFKKTFGGD